MFDTPSLRSRVKLIAAGLVIGLAIGILPEPIGTLGFWDERDRMLLARVMPGLPGVLVAGFIATLTLPMLVRWFLRMTQQEKWLESSAVVHTVSDLALFVACISVPGLLIQLMWQQTEAWSTWGPQLVYAVSLYLGMKMPTIRLIQSIGHGVPRKWRTRVIAIMLMMIFASAIAGIYFAARAFGRFLPIMMLNIGIVVIGLIWLLVVAWLCEEEQSTREDYSAVEESSA